VHAAGRGLLRRDDPCLFFLGRFKLEPAERPDVLAGAVILGACVALVALFTIEYDGFEPLIWIEGVSIWPRNSSDCSRS